MEISYNATKTDKCRNIKKHIHRKFDAYAFVDSGINIKEALQGEIFAARFGDVSLSVQTFSPPEF